MDSGSSITLIHEDIIPPNCLPTKIPPKPTQTTAGTYEISSYVTLSKLSFPEFSSSLQVDSLQAYVFRAPCRYGLIVGRDFLTPNHFDIKFSTKQMEWFDRRVPMKMNDAKTPVSSQLLHDDLDFADNFYQTKGPILPSKYEGIESLEAIVSAQSHLTREEQAKLLTTLQGFHALFAGKLGCYKKKKVHLELKPGSQPKHMKPFPVPLSQHAIFLSEAQRLCDIEVLAKCGLSLHAYPTFIVPKKDGRVRWVSDFRELNKMLVRVIYGIPRIRDIMIRRKKYKYFTKLDLTMHFYTFELDEESSWLCVIVTPFGKYRYLRLPMGICNSPDIAQEAMEEIFLDMRDDEVECFIDDIGIFSMDFDEHMTKLKTVLTRLSDNGFIVNPLKCEWAVKETDWLGYWFTPDGLKPWSKKIEAILRMKEPTTLTELRSFIGAVNYYRDMWPKRAHLLAPLTKLTGSKAFSWSAEQSDAFRSLKAMIVQDTTLHFPDHNDPFDVYTDASDYQLGSVIMQHGRPVAYYSRKLNPAQRNYTTIEKELLSVVATFQEFHQILLGAELHVYTDHKNLTHTNLNTQRVLRWRMYLEVFNPTFHYIKGSDNVLADFLSRVPLSDGQDTIRTPDDPDSDSFLTPLSGNTLEAAHDLLSSTSGKHAIDAYFMDETEYVDSMFTAHVPECFLNVPNGPAPVSYQYLHQQQQNSPELNQMRNAHPHRFQQQVFGDYNLWVYRPQQNGPWRIFCSSVVAPTIIHWFHSVLIHPGSRRLYDTLSQHYYFHDMLRRIETYTKKCQHCIQVKEPTVNYGQLPPREASFQPFFEVAVDSIGPWSVMIGNVETQVKALTIIDTVTCLTEIGRLNDSSAFEAARVFEQSWLYRYPRPTQCIFDAGTEFKADFAALLSHWDIKPKQTGVKNAQANAICERMHRTIGNLLRSLCHTNPPQNINDANLLVERALATTSHALRSTIHRTLNATPGAIVFNRDMFLDIPYVADFIALRNHRQLVIDENLRKENNKRRNHDYNVGDMVYELVRRRDETTRKLSTYYRGPYQVTRVHCNGTLSIRRTPILIDRVNIRRLRPKFD